jgi:hypothetical protein
MENRGEGTHGRLARKVRILEPVHEEEPESAEREQRTLEGVDPCLLTRTRFGLQLLHGPPQQFGMDLRERRKQNLGEPHHGGSTFGHAVRGERFGGRFQEAE